MCWPHRRLDMVMVNRKAETAPSAAALSPCPILPAVVVRKSSTLFSAIRCALASAAAAKLLSAALRAPSLVRSEEHTSELQSLMRISYAFFCLKKKQHLHNNYNQPTLFNHYHNI